MKIYTKTGDDGSTSLFDGSRVDKSHHRVIAYGDIDELIAYLGVVSSNINKHKDLSDLVYQIQKDLFALGATLANPSNKKQKEKSHFDESRTQSLELAIDHYEEELKPLMSFILPGGSILASHFHYARTVCRRAERSVIDLHHHEPINDEVLKYVNRLSDLLFVLARVSNSRENVEDVPWVD